MGTIVRGLHGGAGSQSPSPTLLWWPRLLFVPCAQGRVALSPGWTQPPLRGWRHSCTPPLHLSQNVPKRPRKQTSPPHTAPPQGAAELEGTLAFTWSWFGLGHSPSPCWGDEGPWGPAAARAVAGSSQGPACEGLIIAIAATVGTAAAGQVPGLGEALPTSASSQPTCHHPHFTDEETEAQKGEAPCPRE